METIKDFIIKTGLDLGFRLTESQIEKFFIYLTELKKWNKKINLTAIKDDRLIIIKLFLESLAFTYEFPPPFPPPQGRRVREGVKNILDIGTGAGFPGIPIKIIHPEISFTLLDSSKKKVAFLKHICRQLDLSGIECIAERAEDVAKQEKYKGYFDVVLSKGVAEIKNLLKVSFPLLKSNGLFITQKGDDLEIELKDAEEEMKKDKWVVKNIMKINNPIFGRKFRLITIQIG
ncbi:MAG: 16S rRNA (guanine(527)-N(7))-methyltransferase RsmG [Nitrospinae bacterium]|nr:16S rRNA (guanine(527)-N(7))-methyltransferase RsmG [Nitrospinota bacterium]MBI3814642.1 16S rRNA (guanine(527)-N(7))-methyltransferase RsmG [Nitrospinota bacterium]